ncbi:Galactose mutarotase-like protein [Mycena sanguinolenta]|uniref:Galactose mutarotase-like protein n=1 Tax=Mycena sanguinolenta TaxID=230812 RepID=A0A8H6YBJ8_9AGAR|nr:Galactose mutarotase-like protein [Mycena sanguinolenta]
MASKAVFVLAALVLNAYGASAVDPLVSVNITAPDGSAKASIMPFGATTTNFWVKDKDGNFRDIILGFDNHSLYQSQADGHPYFGPVVGRYANRIRNGTFTIPISKDASGPGKKFQIVENENNGTDTLHGGLVGYDQRPWNLDAHTANSVTFTLVDPNGDQGFPGTVVTTITYTLEAKATWKISMVAFADELTPIMLSCHHYWNLEAYQETQDLVGHFAQFEASKYVGTNGLLIPTGELLSVEGTPLDFRTAKSIGDAIPGTAEGQFCGTGSSNTAAALDLTTAGSTTTPPSRSPSFSMWSVNSGIKLEVTTDQVALQVYSCNGVDSPTLPIPRKVDQGGPEQVYTDHSCVVIEQESYIDGINNPEFPIRPQIFGPLRPYTWDSTYVFSIL